MKLNPFLQLHGFIFSLFHLAPNSRAYNASGRLIKPLLFATSFAKVIKYCHLVTPVETIS